MANRQDPLRALLGIGNIFFSLLWRGKGATSKVSSWGGKRDMHVSWLNNDACYKRFHVQRVTVVRQSSAHVSPKAEKKSIFSFFFCFSSSTNINIHFDYLSQAKKNKKRARVTGQNTSLWRRGPDVREILHHVCAWLYDRLLSQPLTSFDDSFGLVL